MNDFLFELFSEEIPAHFQIPAQEQLLTLAQKELSPLLQVGSMEAHVTPRRLSLMLWDVSCGQGGVLEKKGPAVLAGPEAFEGFCRKWGCAPEDCFQQETPKGAVWIAKLSQAEIPIEVHLEALCRKILDVFYWPKRMRYTTAEGTASWVRPLRGLVCLYGNTPLVWHWKGLSSGALTLGHRFAPNPVIALFCPKTYEKQLKESFVLLRHADRCERIRSDLAELSALCDAVVPTEMEDLIAENAGLTEWPTGVLGQFDPRFLALPAPVIMETLKIHQRCFPLVDRTHGVLMPHFIGILNCISENKDQTSMRQGMERVIHARLSDALFFWTQDCKLPLESQVQTLKDRSFFQGLGSIYDKTERMGSVAEQIANKAKVSSALLKEAIERSKLDLTTGMVGEFPALQGVMGKYYTLEKEAHRPHVAEIAQSLEDQYWPQRTLYSKGPSPLGSLLGLLDRLDTLVGFFSLHIIPSGSKDPMGLRRAATNVVKSCLFSKWDFSPLELIPLCLAAYHRQGFLLESKTIDALPSFLWERFRTLLEETGMGSHFISAIYASKHAQESFSALEQRIKHLAKTIASSEGQAFLAAYRRVHSICLQHSTDPYGFDPSAMVMPQEKALLHQMAEDPSVLAIASWTASLNRFLDEIKVTEAPHQALRLGLLQEVLKTLHSLGDLSVLL